MVLSNTTVRRLNPEEAVKVSRGAYIALDLSPDRGHCLFYGNVDFLTSFAPGFSCAALLFSVPFDPGGIGVKQDTGHLKLTSNGSD